MHDPMLLWVTRSSPFNLRTTRGLVGIGHRAIAAPTLYIRPTGSVPPTNEPTAIVFTSGHAVRHRPLEQRWRSLPVFTVGEHCAGLARGCGYRDVRSAAGCLSALRDTILGSVSRFGHVVHFGARDPAGDLVGELRSTGLSAELSVAYESVEATAEQLGSLAARLSSVDGILVHSPKGARVAAEIVRQAGWPGIVFSLSPACAGPFERLPGIQLEIASVSTEEALIKLVERLRRPADLHIQHSMANPRHSGSDPRSSEATVPIRLLVSKEVRQPPAANDRSMHEPDDPPPAAA
jgi:uroporphyrinogen-III synthase